MFDIDKLDEVINNSIKDVDKEDFSTEEGEKAVTNLVKLLNARHEYEELDVKKAEIEEDCNRYDEDHKLIKRITNITLDLVKVFGPSVVMAIAAFKMADKSIQINNLDDVIPDRDVKAMSMKMLKFK